ncbi:MAG: hypothetical protein PV347_01120 [Rickettsiaceae bacterium]|nr:hypothetical protein [Rickettsiaceae bacterium]MDD9337402.1 hypothetical protein [Rickettsiaceae bacterium]
MTYTTTLASEAIIFFDPAYDHPKDMKLRDDVITTSQQEGLTVVKIIESKVSYDHATLGQLIRQVMTCSNNPVTILIKARFLHHFPNGVLPSYQF